MINVTDLLISQYYRSQKMRDILQAFEDILSENIAEKIQYLKNQMTIKADGIFLDLIGDRLGLQRPAIGSGGRFFGFVEWDDPDETNPALITYDDVTDQLENKGTFSDAPFVPDRQRTQKSSQLATDSAYRKLLIMRGASLLNKCTQDEINAVLESALPGAFVSDNQDMSGECYLPINSSTLDGEVVYDNTNVIPRPAGVNYNIEQFSYFGFSPVDAVFGGGPFFA